MNYDQATFKNRINYRIKKPVFGTYEDLEDILKTAFGMYEDFKLAFV